ncbi:MAG: hypothetical protein ACOC4R_01905 [Bacteroidota bacterium]
MTQQGVSLIIRHQGKENDLKGLLDSFIKHNTYSPLEVFVITSQKIDNVITRYATSFFIRLIRPGQPETLPMGGVIDRAKYSHLLLLDDTARFSGDALQKLSQKKDAAVSTLPDQIAGPFLFISNDAAKKLNQCTVNAPIKELEAMLKGEKPQMKAQPQAKPAAPKPPPKGQGATQAQNAGHKAKPAVAPKAAPAKNQSHSGFGSKANEKELDQQIEALTAELQQIDETLSKQYSDIEKSDKKYDALSGSSEQAKSLMQQLQDQVFQANDTLKNLKIKHDELERLRIRRYSILS